MRVEAWIFSSGVFLFTPLAFVYGFFTGFEEFVGFLGILLAACLSGMLGFYFALLHRRMGGLRPEDDLHAEIDADSGEIGFFSPWSWWPIFTAGTAAVMFMSLAIGWWLFMIGAGFGVIALVGWVYEYYRGDHAR